MLSECSDVEEIEIWNDIRLIESVFSQNYLRTNFSELFYRNWVMPEKDNLFTPIVIRSTKFPNRIGVSSLCTVYEVIFMNSI